MALTKAHNRMIDGANVNVLDFGADPTGVTDSTAAIQAAINVGGAVYIPAGTYSVTGLTLDDNLVMYGDGPDTIILGDGNISIITASSKSYFTVRDMTVKRINGFLGDPLNQTVVLTSCTRFLIDSVIFDGANSTYGGYLILAGAFNSTVNNCRFINLAGLGITSSDVTATGTWSANCVISNCVKEGGSSQGINLYYVRNTTLDNCVSYGSTSTYGCGFVIEYQCENIVLNNCVAYDNRRDGFYIEGNVAYGVRNVTLTNCTSYANGEAGLNLDANFINISVVGGTYRDNLSTFAVGTGHGIMAASNIGLTVTGALITGNTGNGIIWAGTPYQGTFSGNLIRANGGYGIYLDGTPVIINIGTNIIVQNTSGTVFGWVDTAGTYADAEWASYTPIFYKNDGATTVSPLTQSFKFHRIGSICHVTGYFSCNSGDLDGSTYFTVPFIIGWTGGGTGPDALSGRGSATAFGAADQTFVLSSVYFNTRLQAKTTATDTSVRVQATFEIA